MFDRQATGFPPDPLVSDVNMPVLFVGHDTIVQYPDLGRAARLSVPTNEHFLPLLYVLALQYEGEGIRFFTDRVTLGSISMRSPRIG